MRRNDAKSKPDKRQTSTQPPPASTEAKSANTSEQEVSKAFFDTFQRLRRQELSEKDYARVLIMKLFIRIDTLFGRIEKAFAEQPFLPGWAAEAQANQLRLNAYVTDYALAVKLLGSVIELSKAISSMTTTKPTGTGGENDLKT